MTLIMLERYKTKSILHHIKQIIIKKKQMLMCVLYMLQAAIYRRVRIHDVDTTVNLN